MLEKNQRNDDWGERNSYWAKPEGQHSPSRPLHFPEGDFNSRRQNQQMRTR